MINYTTNVEVVNNYNKTAAVTIRKSYVLSSDAVSIIKKFVANRSKVGRKRAVLEFRENTSENNEVNVCYDLCEPGIVENDSMAWHTTFYLTSLGEEIAKKLHFTF